MSDKSTPYHVPHQKRSRESLERLLDAAEECISASGIEGFTIADVVSRADLSVGAFYARFPDKTALLHAVQDRFHERTEPAIHKQMLRYAAEAEGLAAAVERLIDILSKHFDQTRELSRAFMMNSVFDPLMRTQGERVNRERRRVFAAVLLEYRNEIGHDDPLMAIDMAYAMYSAVVRGTLVFGTQHELFYDVTEQTITREIKRAITLYLYGDDSSFAYSPSTR